MRLKGEDNTNRERRTIFTTQIKAAWSDFLALTVSYNFLYKPIIL